MIDELASPAVCVIDDEPDDYKEILAALNALFVGSVHILGNDLATLPPKPFSRLKVIFVDLHLLKGAFGKAAASHTAAVFARVVSPDTAPIVVVIWSKYADEKNAEAGIPVEDQKTEAEVFKETLLQGVPAYNGKLIFVQMPKPQPSDRPADWTANLRDEITKAFDDQEAIDLLWKWDGMVKDACVGVGAGLTELARVSGGNQKEALKDILQRLSKAQGGGDYKPDTASRHVAAVLTQLLADNLEQAEVSPALAAHGNWLGVAPAPAANASLPAHVNGLLLTSNVPATAAHLGPGTIYVPRDALTFQRFFGDDFLSLAELCGRSPQSPFWVEWIRGVMPVMIELSPECDVAQDNYRKTALMIAGLAVPASMKAGMKKAECITTFPCVHVRQALHDFPEQDLFLMFCHRYKATISIKDNLDWLERWFRLRELPAAALRNLHSGQSSRVGYLEVR